MFFVKVYAKLCSHIFSRCCHEKLLGQTCLRYVNSYMLQAGLEELGIGVSTTVADVLIEMVGRDSTVSFGIRDLKYFCSRTMALDDIHDLPHPVLKRLKSGINNPLLSKSDTM